MELLDHLKKYLSDDLPERGKQTQTGVLIPLIRSQNSWHVLLTKRTQTVKTHKGEICFPGGHPHNGENSLQTALREAFEEISLPAENVDLLGRLPIVQTLREIEIVPWVGVVKGKVAFEPQREEVEKIIYLSVDQLKSEGLKKIDIERYGAMIPTLIIKVDEETVWGATGRILHDFYKILKA